MAETAGLLQKILMYRLPKGIRAAFYLVMALFPLLFIGIGYQRETGFTGLIYFGSDFQSRQLPTIQNIPKAIHPGSGYDGQFYAQVAQDPLLNDPQLITALDNPSYRARRILIPALSYLAGLGQPAWILETYALINLPFFWLLIYVVHRFLRPKTVQSFLGMAALLTTTGIVASLSRALLDLPAAVFLFMAAISSSASIGPLFLLLSALSKEASIIALPFIYFPVPFQKTAVLGGLRKAAGVIVPLIAWLAYAAWRLPGGDFAGLQNFNWPLVSIVGHLGDMAALLEGDGSLEAAAEILVTLTLLVQGAYILTQPRLNSPLWRLGAAFLLLYLILGPSVMVEQLAYTRAALPLTLAFNLLIVEEVPAKFIFWFITGNAGIYAGLGAAFLKMIK